MSEDKTPNPKLQFRLPREDNFPTVPFDDPPPLIETAEIILGKRLKITKQGFLLDGKPANTEKVLKAAGLKFKDS